MYNEGYISNSLLTYFFFFYVFSFVRVCACEQKALDEQFVAMEEKENEIHVLQLSMREKERDLERLNNLLAHNEETVNVGARPYKIAINKM